MGDDGGDGKRRGEEEVNESHHQIHEWDRAAESLDNAVHTAFDDVVGFGRIHLAIASPSDSTFGWYESVTEVHGSAKTWFDGDLTPVNSRQDLRRWLNQCQPRSVSFCCLGENILPRSDTHDMSPCPPEQHTQQRARHQSREHRIQRHIATLTTDMVLTQKQGERRNAFWWWFENRDDCKLLPRWKHLSPNHSEVCCTRFPLKKSRSSLRVQHR